MNLVKIGIITDSATGFSLVEMKKYPDITVIPLVIIDQNNTVYEDNNIDITSEKIYQKMIVENKQLKTSQTNREKLSKYWVEALKKYDKVLFLPIAQDASGQYSSAKVVQLEPEFKDKVYVYETGAAMIPLKFMTLIAWTLAKENKSLEEIIASLDNFRMTYECYIAPNNLTYLVRGGRIPSSLAHVANFLKLKAILQCKEKIKNQKIKRTMTHAIKEMLELIITKVKNPFEQTLYVLDAWCDKLLLNQALDAAKAVGFTKIKVEPLCNILKTHTGNNTIGFSVAPNEWIQEV